MTMSSVGRAAWSKGPPLAPHASPHVEVAKGSPSPKLPEHPMVVDSEFCEGLETPLAPD
jgi:hypothetical protein